MDDRELLELAAKAAGIGGEWSADGCDDRGQSCGIKVDPNYIWNPLTDDGDALRLAVKLRISVMHATRHVACDLPHDDYAFEEGVTDGHTRRAIVRAAAEIGRTK